MSDQIYIDTVRDQIKSGVYDHLLPSGNGKVFLDIGANTGQVSKYFLKAKYNQFQVFDRVVAIDPAPETYMMLSQNLSGYQHADCYQVALAPVDAFVPFYVNDINFTASSTVNTYGKQIMVEGCRLRTILRRYKLDHIDVAKIDAEGAEGESLSLEEIDNAKGIIKTYYVETHNCPRTDWQHKLGTLVGNFARCGYTKMRIDGMAVTATK